MNNTKIKKPVIILGCSRSGTTLLFQLLNKSAKLFSLQGESHSLFDGFYLRKQAESKVYSDDVLTDKNLTDTDKKYLLDKFHKNTTNIYIVGSNFIRATYLMCNRHPFLLRCFRLYHYLLKAPSLFLKMIFGRPYRIVEKTPRNCLRISFLDKLFPDAQYIFLKRNGRDVISSLIEGWKKSNSFERCPIVNMPLNIKGIDKQKWHFVLPSGWQDYSDKSVEEVAAFQWISTNRAVIDGLKQIDKKRVYSLCYEDLIQNSESTVKDLCEFIQIPYAGGIRRFSKKLPIFRSVHGNRPDKDKWRKHEALLQNIYSMIKPMMQELGYDLNYIEDER